MDKLFWMILGAGIAFYAMDQNPQILHVVTSNASSAVAFIKSAIAT